VYTVGHAMAWDPARGFRLGMIVSREAMERDYVSTAMAPAYAKEGQVVAPLPAHCVREAASRFEGRAFFNLGEAGLLIYPLLVNGRLVTKPPFRRVVLQREWSPLEGRFPFFMQHGDGRVSIREMRIENGALSLEDRAQIDASISGFSAPWIVRNGEHVPLVPYKPAEAAESGRTSPGAGEVIFPGGDTRAAVSALGITKEGICVRISLLCDLDDPQKLERMPTEYDLVRFLKRWGVVNALYTGASADVQYFDTESGAFRGGIERVKSEDRRWILNPGQSERGLVVIGRVVEGLVEHFWTHPLRPVSKRSSSPDTRNAA
jgi:hypothetical protein